MADPTTPLPDFEAGAEPEREMLTAFLDYFRVVLVRKIEGLSEEQARTPACPPSDLTLLGLVRHMAEVERIWSQWLFSGGPNVPLYYGDAHPDGDPDGDFHPPADATIADAVATFWAETAAADEIYRAADFDDIEAVGSKGRSLRWIHVHLVEEYARHCGHADLLRQAIDGVTGD